MNNSLDNKTTGFTIAAILAIALNTLLTWAKESYPPLLAAMKSIAHHWTVHGVVVVLFFFVVGFALSKWPIRRMNGTFLASLLFLVTAAASIGLVGFFLLEG